MSRFACECEARLPSSPRPSRPRRLRRTPRFRPLRRCSTSAQARLRDAETVASLSAEGAALYEREAIKLRGYQYCSHAVALAERGEFRQSVRAASKALHLGQEGGNDDLVAHSMRDLAIAYSYSGNLDLAEQYARDAFKHEAKDPQVIAGPAYKVLGDVAVRRGQLAEAIGHYEQASASSSDRFRPLVQISLANAYVTAGKPQEARALYEKIAVPREPALRQTYRRGLGNLLLAEGKNDEALKYFSEAADGGRWSRCRVSPPVGTGGRRARAARAGRQGGGAPGLCRSGALRGVGAGALPQRGVQGRPVRRRADDLRAGHRPVDGRGRRGNRLGAVGAEPLARAARHRPRPCGDGRGHARPRPRDDARQSRSGAGRAARGRDDRGVPQPRRSARRVGRCARTA